jgi:hypothetical protein
MQPSVIRVCTADADVCHTTTLLLAACSLKSQIKLWLRAVATPPGQTLDPQILGVEQRKSSAREAAQKKRADALKRAAGGGGGGIQGIGEADGAGKADDDEILTNLDDLSASVQMRLAGVRAMGALAWRLQSTGGDKAPIETQITSLMTASQLGTHAQVGALLLAEWATAACASGDGRTSYVLPPALSAVLDEKLATIKQPEYPYAEIADLSAKWRGELRLVLEDYSKAGVKEASAALKGTNVASLSVEQVQQLMRLAGVSPERGGFKAEEWEGRVKEKDPKKAAEGAKRRTKAVRQVFITMQQLHDVQASLHTSVLAAVASALVAAQNLEQRAAIGPVIRALTDSLECEENLDLQRRTAKAMVGLLQQCAARKNCPNGKIINNLASYLCEDTSFTPACTAAPGNLDDVTMDEIAFLPTPDEVVLAGSDDEAKKLRVKKRGASMALEEIARGGLGGVAGGVFKALPALWVRMHDPLVQGLGEVKDASGKHFEVAKVMTASFLVFEFVDVFESIIIITFV